MNKEINVGDKVKVVDIYNEHPVHKDEDSGEYPKKTALKNLKRFKGLVGIVIDVSYEKCYESYWLVTVKFSEGTEEYFSEYELEKTTEDISEDIPKAIKVIDSYEPLNASEKNIAIDILKAVVSSPGMSDKVLSNKKHYTEECIELAIRLSEQVNLHWYRGQKEVIED